MANTRDGTSEALYVRLCSHIAELEEPNTSTPPQTTTPNARLFDEAALVLPDYLTAAWGPEQPTKRLDLMRRLASGLATYSDPTPAAHLLARLFASWSWTQVAEFAGSTPIPWAEGLAPGEGMVPFNRLVVGLLAKAVESAVDAAEVAGMRETVLGLVRCWLCTPDVGVAMEAGEVLVGLLRVDREVVVPPRVGIPEGRGQGLVWKRVFGDRDVYAVFFEACSERGRPEKGPRTLAQARLMEFVPKVGGMDWGVVSKSQHEDVEERYGVKGGLLDFATLVMVDYKDDVLMYRCLIDFYSEILEMTKSTVGQIPGGLGDSLGLQYLITHGLHARIAAIYLQLPGSSTDPVESMFLPGPAAHYIATYASGYPKHFLASQMAEQVKQRLKQTLDMSPSRWSHVESPISDLHLLTSLPRTLLLPSSPQAWNSSLIALIPSQAANADALSTLATIFHGPASTTQIIEYPPTSPLANPHDESPDQETEEAAAARALYFHYTAHNPNFWSSIVKHANTVALADVALAAIAVIHAVITANWGPLPATPSAPTSTSTHDPLPLPTQIPTPATGTIAILSPPALQSTLPYLFSPAPSFSNLVGGRGDAESAAYRVATAKFAALGALHKRLADVVAQTPGEGYEEIRETIGKRLAMGAMSKEGEVGGRIATV